jgi:ABC-type spermidine/putrescine transport system permease subunit II
MYLYSQARGGTTTPALNALATVLVLTTLIGIGVAYLIYVTLGKRTGSDTSALRELSGMAEAA